MYGALRTEATKLQRKISQRDTAALIISPTKYDTVWKTMGHALPGNDYMKRVLEYHKLLVKVNGMLGVFSFIAFEEQPEALERVAMNGYPIWKELYGIVSILGFLFASTAAIVSLMLFSMMTILGPEGARFYGGMISCICILVIDTLDLNKKNIE